MTRPWVEIGLPSELFEDGDDKLADVDREQLAAAYRRVVDDLAHRPFTRMLLRALEARLSELEALGERAGAVSQ